MINQKISQKGFIHLIPLILIFIAFISIGIYLSRQNTSKSQDLVAFIVTPTILPKATTLPSPTITPSLTPSPTPSPKPTVKPTEKPTTQVFSGIPGTGYNKLTVHTEKGDFTASILSINLASVRVVTDTGNDSDCANNCNILPLQDYINRNGGFAGVDGSYFCPSTYPDCSAKTNSFDFPVYNSRLNKWINGGNLFWNSRSIIYFDGSGGHYLQNAKDFGGGLTAGIVNYPGLVTGGNVQIDDNQSGLSDKQKTVGTKVGIGLIGTNNVIVVIAGNVNMQQFAYVFKALRADSALNLDTGGSTALYYNGRYLYGPGRNLPNAIIFVKK